ncbi:Vitamin B12 transporter BtuB [Thalassocella blandensis]|nr:Vitamin B12 transporter BtuB [Thalassocella blandensis]
MIIFNKQKLFTLMVPVFLAQGVTADTLPADEIVVVTSRSEKKLFDTLSSVSLVDAQTIEKLQVKDLGEIFELVTSTDVVRSGSAGSATSVFTRGMNANHTLLLINGQKFSSATLGTSQFNLVDPALVKRVEFLRGSRSAIYGSDALAGVIDIKTNSDTEESESSVYLEKGSFNSNKLALSTSQSLESFSFDIGLSHFVSDGFDSTEDTAGFNADEDGFENNNANVIARYKISDKGALSFNYFYVDSESDYDSLYSPDTQPYSQNQIRVGSVNLDWTFNARYSSNVSYNYSSDESQEKDRQIESAFLGKFATARHNLFWQNELVISENAELLFGLDLTDESVETTSELSDTERDIRAPFAQLSSTFGMWTFDVGFRSDDYGDFGKNDSESLAVGVNITSELKLFASYAEGFKVPTFNDLGWPDDGFSVGNKFLKAESSENGEIGLRYFSGDIYLDAAVFNNKVENLIDWAPGDDGKWSPQNIASAKFKGAELTLGMNLDNWLIELNSSYVDPKNGETGKIIDRRSKTRSNLRFEYQFSDSWLLGTVVKYRGSRFENDGAEKLDAVTMLDAYLTLSLSEELQLNMKLNNISDEDYQLIPGYNQAGRAGSVSLRLQF